jgi:hypothetical protein
MVKLIPVVREDVIMSLNNFYGEFRVVGKFRPEFLSLQSKTVQKKSVFSPQDVRLEGITDRHMSVDGKNIQ